MATGGEDVIQGVQASRGTRRDGADQGGGRFLVADGQGLLGAAIDAERQAVGVTGAQVRTRDVGRGTRGRGHFLLGRGHVGIDQVSAGAEAAVGEIAVVRESRTEEGTAGLEAGVGLDQVDKARGASYVGVIAWRGRGIHSVDEVTAAVLGLGPGRPSVGP